MNMVDHKIDTLSLGGGGGSWRIGDTAERYSDKGADYGTEVGGLVGGILGICVIVRRGPMLFSLEHEAEANFVKFSITGGAMLGKATGALVGAGVGAGVGTVDALRHSGGTRNSSGRSTSSPARRF